MSRVITTFLTTRWPALLGAMLLGYGLTLAAFSREGFPESMDYGFGMPYLSDRPVGEDAFYMLTVAWNIAEEGHIVYNLHKPTTGIQPLATVVYAALARVIQFLGGDKWALVRAVIGLNVLLLVLFARQLGRIAAAAMVRPDGRELASALAIVTTLSSVWAFRVFTYGLEIGIYLVLLALAFSPVCFAALAASQMHSGHMILDLPINAGFVRAHLDDRRLVGAFQSGTVGYFNGRVVNLDGKIDFQAQYAMSQGGIRAYIDDQQIDVLLDWPQLCELCGDGVPPRNARPAISSQEE